MMKTACKLSLMASCMMVLSACGNKFEESLQRSIIANQTATSLEEWVASESNSDKVFADWRAEFYATNKQQGNGSVGSEVCKQLSRLDAASLAQFDNNILDDDNKTLLKDCKDSLVKKIDLYYAKEEASLGNKEWRAQRASRHFPDNIQKRDFSRGYFAINGDLAKKEVILTFDDGPSGQYTPQILAALKAVNAKAIFFALGKAAKANPALLKKVAADGHVVGSHTVNHLCIGNQTQCRKSNGGRLLSYEKGVSEIAGGHNIIFDILGYADHFFRFPYGGSSPALKNFLASNQVGEFFWNIDSNDWRNQTPASMIQSTMAQLDKHGRGIILFHDIQRKTAIALPTLLEKIYDKGYSIVLLQPMDANSKYRRLNTVN